MQQQLSDLNSLLIEATRELSAATDINQLEHIKASYLGKSGALSKYFSLLKTLSLDTKVAFGGAINSTKTQIETTYKQHKELLEANKLQALVANGAINTTIPHKNFKFGAYHPVTLARMRMLSILRNFGFEVTDGPEVETDHYNFEMLNIPKNHPSRTMQDTFYTENNLLRTHTSSLQVRFGLTHKPPFRVLAPGRVYRVDMDKTHSPMFHQLEGLWIDKNVSFCNLKWLMHSFLKLFFANDNLQLRFRASYFPFTEPSAEIDIMDEKSGQYLEVAGCGMVHPQVLTNMNINPDEYSGFAFGLGIDRFAMLYYGISDLRSLFENELDMLNQFRGVRP